MAAQQPAGHAAPPIQAVIMPRPVKVHLPDLFDGSRQQLSSFFGQLALYFGFHTDQFPDRKSTRLNSSHSQISYAVFCLKKKTSMAIVVVVVGDKSYASLT